MEERVRNRRHSPMQPDSFLARNTWQQSHSPISQGIVLGIDTAPDAQEDASGLGPGFLAWKLFPKPLIDKRTQFLLVGRLDQTIQHIIEPCPFQPVRDANSVPHPTSLVITTNGTITSSSEMPPWATISSPSLVNAFKSPAR